MTPLERVARAICLGESRNPLERRTLEDGTILFEWELREPAARAAIEAHKAALEDAGLVIVPRKPTGEMVVAGAKTMAAAMPDGEAQTAVIYGQPKDVFNAMIAEATK